MEQFYFFWGGPASQWASSPFTIGDITFNCAEQYMMYKKAMLFNDTETAQSILETNNPRVQKALGRKVKDFKQDIWDQNADQIVYDANYAKFTQNADLKQWMLGLGDVTFVEASPLDNIWGIGLSADDPRALSRDTWLGANRLGDAITKVRNVIADMV